MVLVKLLACKGSSCEESLCAVSVFYLRKTEAVGLDGISNEDW